ncbi:MAG: hypothetical protein GX797_04860 [Chloroflexi bacterium]|nr:hypothetical protein [Chloroflexota bacterium]
MVPQISPDDATYVAEIVVSIIGVFVLFAIVLWLISKKTRPPKPTQPAEGAEPRFDSSNQKVTYAQVCPPNPVEAQDRRQILRAEFERWQSRHLLPSEDGKSLFVRTGVERNGLRYQLATTAQAQALAMLVMTLLAEFDRSASTKTEALFASLLAHPAAREANLTSWQFLPDLPRSPRLDADLHADAWVLFALITARKQWQSLQRFDYDMIVANRSLALFQHWRDPDLQASELLPNSSYLLAFLERHERANPWEALNSTQPILDNHAADRSRFALSLLQLGLQALVNPEHTSPNALLEIETDLRARVEEEFSGDPLDESENFSTFSYLACYVPALIVLKEQELLKKTWHFFTNHQANKDDGLGATLKILAMAVMTNQVWLEKLD